jgi:hypothetical protein
MAELWQVLIWLLEDVGIAVTWCITQWGEAASAAVYTDPETGEVQVFQSPLE